MAAGIGKAQNGQSCQATQAGCLTCLQPHTEQAPSSDQSTAVDVEDYSDVTRNLPIDILIAFRLSHCSRSTVEECYSAQYSFTLARNSSASF